MALTTTTGAGLLVTATAAIFLGTVTLRAATTTTGNHLVIGTQQSDSDNREKDRDGKDQYSVHI
jgi:hypothetical protein